MTTGPSILHNSELKEFLQEVEIIENVVERRNAITSWVYMPELKKKVEFKKFSQKLDMIKHLEQEYRWNSNEQRSRWHYFLYQCP